MKKLLHLFAPIFICLPTFAQNSQNKYANVFQNAGNTLTFSQRIIKAPANGCLLLGQGNTVLLRLDNVGNAKWSQVLAGNEVYTDVECNLDTTFYALSSLKTNSNGALNGITVTKLSDHGNSIWSKKVSLSSAQYTTSPASLAITWDSGLVICGRAQALLLNTFVSRLNKNGTLLWSKLIYTNSTSGFTSVKQTSDSGFILSGAFNSSSLVKLDKNGTVQWAKSFTDQPGSTYNVDVTVRDSSIFVFLTSAVPKLMKLDQSGNSVMMAQYNFQLQYPYQNGTTKIKNTADKGFLLSCAYYDSYSTEDASFIKTDSLGKSQWAVVGHMTSADAVQVDDEGYVMAGNGPVTEFAVRLSGLNDPQVGVIKMDSAGSSPGVCIHYIVTNTAFINTFTASPLSYTETADGALQSGSITTNTLTITSFSGCVTTIIEGGIEAYGESVRLEIFPNPSSGVFNVEWKSEPLGPVNYSIFNLSGEKVKEENSVKETSHQLDGSKLPPSVYILRTSVRGQVIKNERLIIAPH